jgi:uncharacterized protein YecT (DUF1311 family)
MDTFTSHRRAAGGGSPVAGGLVLAAVAVAAVAAVGLLAGCSGKGTQPASTATRSVTTTGGAAASAAAASSTGSSPAAPVSPAAAAAFAPITEPFDPGHPARPVSGPASCAGQSSTLAIEGCYNDKTETADAAIDTVRQAAFASASAAQRSSVNSADQGWLAARSTVCAKAYQTGGTIDGINIAACLLDESTARLDAVKGITPPEAVLKSTDSTSLSDVSWYTTPAGSRIGMIDTQGDETGGVIVSWVIIAGSAGFVVNPAQFTYHDGSFTDAGIVSGINPAGHHVAPGTEYELGIDYSRLSADPKKASNTGGYVYAPGSPVAVWH